MANKKEYPNNIMAEYFKVALVKCGDKKLSGLASDLNCSSTNIYNKFARNNFSEAEMRDIADALGLRLEISLIKKYTGEKI